MRRLSIASPDSGAESPAYGEEPSAAADRDPAAMPPRAGGGGRWSLWPMRAVLWVAILIITDYRGVTAILSDKTPSSGSGTGKDTAGTSASGFPVWTGPFPARSERGRRNPGQLTTCRSSTSKARDGM